MRDTTGFIISVSFLLCLSLSSSFLDFRVSSFKCLTWFYVGVAGLYGVLTFVLNEHRLRQRSGTAWRQLEGKARGGGGFGCRTCT